MPLESQTLVEGRSWRLENYLVQRASLGDVVAVDEEYAERDCFAVWWIGPDGFEYEGSFPTLRHARAFVENEIRNVPDGWSVAETSIRHEA